MALEFESLQFAAMELGEDISPHDRTGLETLSTAHLREQREAREELYDYVDGLWEKLKAGGVDPAGRDEYQGLAGLRDLDGALRDNAVELLTARED
ncbi:hypothetical protein [Streptomyces sp. NPDC052042]|uniref:hypothetical protein n=1 Tax=Streptomyces sp. NPDC052042 TaxID=3365683 RepID=UPI0037D22EE7